MGALAVDGGQEQPTPAADEPTAEATTESVPVIALGAPPSEDEPAEPAPAPPADEPAVDATTDDEPTTAIGTPPSEEAAIEPTSAAAVADARSEDESTAVMGDAAAGEPVVEPAPASNVDEPTASMEDSAAEAESAEQASPKYDEVTEPLAHRGDKGADPVTHDADDVAEPIAQQIDEISEPADDEDDAETMARQDGISEPDADEEVTAQQDEPTAREDDDAEAPPQHADDEVAEPVGLIAAAAEPAPHAPAKSNEPFFAPVSSVFEEDDAEKTRVIRLPAAAESTDDSTAGPGESTRDIDLGGKTRVIGPGERTQIIFRRDPAELAARAAAAQAERDRLAQDRARQAFRDRAAQERARQAFAARAAEAAREVGVETEVIDIAARRQPDRSRTPESPPGDLTRVSPDGDADDQTQVFRRGDNTADVSDDQTQVFRRGNGTTEVSGDLTQAFPRADRTGDNTGEVPGDQTQVIPLGIGTVEPPGEQTQVLRFATPQPPGDNTTTSTGVPDGQRTPPAATRHPPARCPLWARNARTPERIRQPASGGCRRIEKPRPRSRTAPVRGASWTWNARQTRQPTTPPDWSRASAAPRTKTQKPHSDRWLSTGRGPNAHVITTASEA